MGKQLGGEVDERARILLSRGRLAGGRKGQEGRGSSAGDAWEGIRVSAWPLAPSCAPPARQLRVTARRSGQLGHGGLRQ